MRQREALRRTPAGESQWDEASMAELAARERARHALDMSSVGGWGQAFPAGSRTLPLLVVAALGLPVLVALARRGTAGGWLALGVALAALALLSVWRRP